MPTRAQRDKAAQDAFNKGTPTGGYNPKSDPVGGGWYDEQSGYWKTDKGKKDKNRNYSDYAYSRAASETDIKFITDTMAGIQSSIDVFTKDPTTGSNAAYLPRYQGLLAGWQRRLDELQPKGGGGGGPEAPSLPDWSSPQLAGMASGNRARKRAAAGNGKTILTGAGPGERLAARTLLGGMGGIVVSGRSTAGRSMSALRGGTGLLV